MILAKSHVLDVRLYLQPQRAAFPGFARCRCGRGSVLTAPAPAACLGVLQEATLHLIGAATHSDTPRGPRNQDRSLSWSTTTLASCTHLPVRCSATWSQPTDLGGAPGSVSSQERPKPPAGLSSRSTGAVRLRFVVGHLRWRLRSRRPRRAAQNPRRPQGDGKALSPCTRRRTHAGASAPTRPQPPPQR
jgi:hypothetical protein